MEEKENKPWLLPLIIFAVVAGAALLFLFPKMAFWAVGPSPVPKDPAVDVVRSIAKAAEENMPGQSSYEWDREKDTFTFFVWDSSFARTGKDAKAGYKNSQQSWDELAAQLGDICESLQKKFTAAGLGTTVAVCAVDADHHDTVLLMVSREKVLYDAAKD